MASQDLRDLFGRRSRSQSNEKKQKAKSEPQSEKQKDEDKILPAPLEPKIVYVPVPSPSKNKSDTRYRVVNDDSEDEESEDEEESTVERQYRESSQNRMTRTKRKPRLEYDSDPDDRVAEMVNRNLAEKIKKAKDQSNSPMMKKLFDAFIEMDPNFGPKLNKMFKEVERETDQEEAERDARDLWELEERYEAKVPIVLDKEKTINSISRRADLSKAWPYKGTAKKYECNEKAGQMSIHAFLTEVGSVQEAFELNREEFLRELLSSTGGNLQRNLNSLIQSKKSIAQIWLALYAQYDSRQSCEAAIKEMAAYKINKNMEFREIVAKVTEMAQNANAKYTAGPFKERKINDDCISTLRRVLPQYSDYYVEEAIEEYREQNSADPDFLQIIKSLRPYTRRINDEIARYGGIDWRKSKETGTKPKSSGGSKSVNAVQAVQGAKKNPNQASNSHDTNPNQKDLINLDGKGGTKKKGKGKQQKKVPQVAAVAVSQGHQHKGGWQGGQGGQGNQGYANQNKGQGNYQGGSGYQKNNDPLCCLCGYNCHSPVHCPYMTDERGNVVTVTPVAHCPVCPSNVKRMRHPPQNCPFRPGGPFSFRDSNFKFPQRGVENAPKNK